MITKDMWIDVFEESDITSNYFHMCSQNSTESDVEKHHILPRSIWPEYEFCDWNIVKLSLEDHYRVHEMLPFMCRETVYKYKMAYAWNLVNGVKQRLGLVEGITAEKYAELRRLHKEAVSNGQIGRKHSEETKAKLSAAMSGEKHRLYGLRGEDSWMWGRKLSQETKDKMSAAHKGKPNGKLGTKHKPETIEKMKAARNRPGYKSVGMLGKTHSEEAKAKMREAKRVSSYVRKPMSEESKAKLSATQKARLAAKKLENNTSEVAHV